MVRAIQNGHIEGKVDQIDETVYIKYFFCVYINNDIKDQLTIHLFHPMNGKMWEIN